MYAVVKSGGKQYRVSNDQKLLVDRIDAKEGSIVTLDNILMLVDNGKIVDKKTIDKIAVSASVVRQTRGPKIITLKHRRRKNSRRVRGHRQDLTLLKVLGIGDPAKLVIKKDEAKKGSPKKEASKKIEDKKISQKKDVSKKDDDKNNPKKKVVKKVTKKATSDKVETKSKKK